MSSQILLSYKADETTHTASDDLESLVYVLIWMCVLYAGPGTLRQDKHITDTVLKPWVSVTNATEAVSLGMQKAGLKTAPTHVTLEFTTYFQPTHSIVANLLTALDLKWSKTDHIANYKVIWDILLEGFDTVEEIPNWNAHKDVYGYGLLNKGSRKCKLPPYVTAEYSGGKAESESSRAVRQRYG